MDRTLSLWLVCHRDPHPRRCRLKVLARGTFDGACLWHAGPTPPLGHRLTPAMAERFRGGTRSSRRALVENGARGAAASGQWRAPVIFARYVVKRLSASRPRRCLSSAFTGSHSVSPHRSLKAQRRHEANSRWPNEAGPHDALATTCDAPVARYRSYSSIAARSRFTSASSRRSSSIPPTSVDHFRFRPRGEVTMPDAPAKPGRQKIELRC